MSKKLAIRDPETARCISALQDFKTHGAMYGFYIPIAGGYYGPSGWLANDGKHRWDSDQRIGTIDYVVFSYQTPIAWHTPEFGWVVVSRNFSSTSAKHQAQARWGVQMSDDHRITSVMHDYRLTQPQRALLEHIYATGGYFPQSAQTRSAAVLERKGLVSYNFPGQLIVTSTGMVELAS